MDLEVPQEILMSGIFKQHWCLVLVMLSWGDKQIGIT